MNQTQIPDYWKSMTGWLFAVGYLVLAVILFYKAQTCTGWVCDLVALPAAIPFGIPIGWIIDTINYFFPIPGHSPTFHFRNGYFILPTVLANTIFYYWIGLQFKKLGNWLLQKIKN